MDSSQQWTDLSAIGTNAITPRSRRSQIEPSPVPSPAVVPSTIAADTDETGGAAAGDMGGIMGMREDGLLNFHRREEESARISLSQPNIASSMLVPHYDVVLKIFYTIPVGFGLLLVVLFEGEKYLLQCIAVALIIIKLFWFSFFSYTILSAKKLRHFRSLLCIFNDFSNITIPYGIKGVCFCMYIVLVYKLLYHWVG